MNGFISRPYPTAKAEWVSPCIKRDWETINAKDCIPRIMNAFSDSGIKPSLIITFNNVSV